MGISMCEWISSGLEKYMCPILPSFWLQNEAEARAKSGASAFSRAKAWVEHRGGGWMGLAVGCAVAFLGTTVLKRAAGAAVSSVPSGEDLYQQS